MESQLPDFSTTSNDGPGYKHSAAALRVRPPYGRRLAVRSRRRETIDALVFASPWFVGFLIFLLLPFARSLVYSFQSYDILNPPTWVGLANYVQLLHDPRFHTAVANTLFYTVIAVPLEIVVALLLAVLLSRRMVGRSLLTSIFFLPSVITGVAVTFIWKLMFQGDYGLINNILHYIGINGPAWLDNPASSKPALIVMRTWNVGMTMVIFIAAISGLPDELFEAARIDGAGAVRMFRSITLPLMTPAIFYALIINVNNALQLFTEVYALTGRPPLGAPGGPVDSTLVVVLYLYDSAFTFLTMGYASAEAWVLFLIILLITLVQFRAQKRWVHYE